MFMASFWLITALGLALCAGAAHIIGLQVILSGLNQPMYEYLGMDGSGMLLLAIPPVIIIGIFIEFGKLSGIAVLTRYWGEKGYIGLKIATSVLVLFALLLTSAGVYGFLSKSTTATQLQLTEKSQEIPILQSEIDALQRERDSYQKVIDNFDAQLQKLVDELYVTQSERIRQQQQPERNRLNQEITELNKQIAQLQQQVIRLQLEVDKVETEFAPARLLGEFLAMIGFAGASSESNVVKILVFMIVMVLDPMAMCLFIWAQMHFRRQSEGTMRVMSSFFNSILNWRKEVENKKQDKLVKLEALKNEEVSRLMEELEKKKANNDELEEEYENKIKQLKSEYEETIEKINKEREEKEQKEREEYEQAREQLEKLAKEKSDEVENQKTAIVNLHDENENLKVSLEELKRQHEKNIEALRAEYEQILEQNKEEYQKLLERLDSDSGVVSQELEEAKSELEALSNTLDGELKQKEKFQNELEEKQREIKELEEETFKVVKAYDKKIDEMVDHLDRLGRSISIQKDNHENEMLMLNDYYQEEFNNQQENHRNEIKELDESYSKKLDELRNTVKELREHIESMKSEFEKREESLNEEHEKSVNTLINRYEQKVNDNSSDREKLTKKYENQIEKLKSDLDYKDKVIEEINQKLEEYDEGPTVDTVDDLIRVLDKNPTLMEDFMEFASGKAKKSNQFIKKFYEIQEEEKNQIENPEDFEKLDNDALRAAIDQLDYTSIEKQEDGSSDFYGPETRVKPDPPKES